MIELVIERYAQLFENKDEAQCRLDSIAYLGGSLGLDSKQIMLELDYLCRLALPYSRQQIEVLALVERRYNEAIQDTGSRLHQFLRGQIKDPVQRLYERAEEYRGQYERKLALTGIDNAAEDTLLAFKVPDVRRTMHTRRGADKTGS